MKKPTELKKHAVSRLAGCWGECCAVFFIMVGELAALVLALILYWGHLVRSAAGDLPLGTAIVLIAVIAVLLWFAVAPFSYGIKWYRIQQLHGSAVHARSMFSCYLSLKKLIQVLKLNSMLTLRRMPMFIAAAAAVFAELYMLGEIRPALGNGSLLYSVLVALAIMLGGTAVCIWVITGIKYAPVPYLYALDPGANPAEIIRKSKRLMKNNSRYLLEAMFSVIGWVVPCILIFPMIFIVPYIEMVYAAAINEIIENDMKKETLTEDERYAEKLS